MSRITCAILLAGFIAASTSLSVVREDGDLLDTLAHKDTKKLGEEAIQLGEILRKCAKNLKNQPIIEEFPGDEAEEYFLGKIWENIKSSAKEAVRDAKENIKNSIKNAAMDAKKTIINSLKKAAMDAKDKITDGVKDAAWQAKEKIKNSVKDAAREALEKFQTSAIEYLGKKAENLMGGLINKQRGSYSVEDNESYIKFVAVISNDIDQMGQDLIEQGRKLLEE
uniref:Protein serine/threonine kinase n=2 Tax=Ixodes ricinus TaxID=34613 RepID=V5ICT8_IXORI